MYSLKILTFCYEQTPNHKLQDILPAFPNLQLLDIYPPERSTPNRTHKSLYYLKVTKMDDVNLGTILEHCSNLRELHISFVNRFTQSHLRQLKPNKPYLPSLEHVIFWATDCNGGRIGYSGQPPARDLTILLQSTLALANFQFAALDNLSDQIFQEVVVQPGFRNLEEM